MSDSTCRFTGSPERGRNSPKSSAERPRTEMRTVLVLAAAAACAWGHHSFGAEYDANKPVTITGVVTEVQWTNPHIYFFLDVKNQKGALEHWKFEGYPPGVLNRIGWKRNMTMVKG